MLTIGVDFSKKSSVYRVLDAKGQWVAGRKIENRPEFIHAFLDELAGPKQLALEATRNWGLYYECVKEHVDRFYLGHPKKMKAITQSETKNDSNDAQMIARLTYSGFLPQAYVCDLDMRQLRSLLRFRHFLVDQRRSIRNQVQTLLDRNLWPHERPGSFKDPFCRRGLQWLRALALPERERFILDQALTSFEHLSAQIGRLEEFLQTQTFDLPGLPWLRTVPGFRRSQVNALVVLTEVADIRRFRKADHLIHYAGLIPRERSSGDKHRTGRLVKEANLHLRRAFLESTLAAIRAQSGLKAYYQSVKTRAGSGAGIVATARKLASAVYWVLKEQRPYRPEKVFVLSPAAACHPATVTDR